MGKIIIDAVGGYKRVYHPTKCEECLLCDDSIGWCIYYRNRTNGKAKPGFCKVISIIVEEE